MLYTGLFFINLYDNFFVPNRGYPLKNMPLWIALYTAIPGNPSVPPDVGGWTRWRIWQYSENATVAGVSNPVDANWGPNNLDKLTQPDAVTGVKAVRTGNVITVTWNRNPDFDLLGYNIFANNYWIGTVDANDTKFTINTNELPFTPNGPIRIGVEAFDEDGEVSQNRTVASV